MPARDPQSTDTDGRLDRTDLDHIAAHDFLLREAELLDAGRAEEWLDLVHPDLEYRMPVRITRWRRDGDGFDPSAGHFDDNYASVVARVKHLGAATSWAEDPPSRVRRFVDNVRVWRHDPAGLEVWSYFLLLRSRWDNPTYEMLSGERRDVLEPSDGRLLLRRRTVLADQTNLGMLNLSVIF